LAHVLNLIVKDILSELGSGNRAEANTACDSLGDGGSYTAKSALDKLRVLALWVQRSPQRKQQWKDICNIHNLRDKLIQYDVDTQWNSTYRMVMDGLKAREQVTKFIQLQTTFPPFVPEDWLRLKQIAKVLSKFDSFTLEVSKNAPQISMVLPMYYELHELLHEASDGSGDFADLDPDVIAAIKKGLKKYEKYYDFMDACDIYYITTILDPRIKGSLILQELSDGDAAKDIITNIRLSLQQRYSLLHPTTAALPADTAREFTSESSTTIGSRLFQKLHLQQQPQVSDIDRYFDRHLEYSDASNAKDPMWVCEWWRRHRYDYPRMAAAARDYLAIPASGVDVERLFNKGRDILGIRRKSLKAKTIRMLMLLDHEYCNTSKQLEMLEAFEDSGSDSD
jgi:hAT family C-terminal dimerisation region